MRAAAFALCALSLLVTLGLYFGGAAYLPAGAWPASPAPAALWEGLLLAGLLGLPAGLATGPKAPRAAGLCLLFGAALVGLGLALNAGPYLNRYFPGFFAAVLPMAVAGGLFLLSARRR